MPKHLSFAKLSAIMLSGTTLFSLGGGKLKYRAAVLLTLCIALAMGIVGPGARAQEAGEPSLADEFAGASEEYGVPQELLRAMGYVNTGWEMPPPDASPYDPNDLHGRGAYGVMQLQQNPSRDTLGRASDLTGLTEEELKNDRAANVRGGAAVLADIAGEPKPTDLDGWFDAVAEYGGGTLYAEEVFGALKEGASATTESGEKLVLGPREGIDSETKLATKAGGQYPGSTWYGNNGSNYTNASRGAAQIDKVIIHVAQGSYSGTLDWFRNPSNTGSSAHYTVSKSGNIGQSVSEQDIAWHAGWWDYNKTSVGIEHDGYVSNSSWFTDAKYRASAKLTAYLVRKYNIPIDRDHIIGHVEVPGCSGTGGGAGCHTDPGRYWNWTKYMNYVRGFAGGGGGAAPYTQVVDNSSNRFRASTAWKADAANPQRYGASYRVATPGATYSPAQYRLNVPRGGRYAVYAWWPSSVNYNRGVVFRISTANGVAQRTVNQEQNGRKWVRLGVFNMAAGDGWKVKISNKSSLGNDPIIADAVKITGP
jgi:hypothetical protein